MAVDVHLLVFRTFVCTKSQSVLRLKTLYIFFKTVISERSSSRLSSFKPSSFQHSIVTLIII